MNTVQGVARILFQMGNILGGRPRGGSGGEVEFPKIFKNLLMQIAKMHYFSIFFKKVNKSCVNFSRVWKKSTHCWEILKIFDEN